MSPRKFTIRTPKSQSEKARDKADAAKSGRLERAGTALINGKPAKAKKLVEKKPKPLTGAQACEIVAESQTIERQLVAVEHKIDGVKEEYKELKAEREKLLHRLREEIRHADQGRLQFGGPLPTTAKGETKGAKPDPKSPGNETSKPNGETPAKAEESVDSDGDLDELEAVAKKE